MKWMNTVRLKMDTKGNETHAQTWQIIQAIRNERVRITVIVSWLRVIMHNMHFLTNLPAWLQC